MSEEIPVDVAILDVARKFHSETDDDRAYEIKFSITNRADSGIAQVAFIEYHFGSNGQNTGTTVWSEREFIAPNETRHFTTYTSFGDYENERSFWSVHSVCTEFGTIDLNLKGVERSVQSFALGKKLPLPKAKGSLFPRCGRDE